MFYIIVIFIPLLILTIGYSIRVPKPKKFSDYVKLIFKVLPFLFCYSFLLYFLEMEDILKTGWAFYTLMFVLLPTTCIALLFHFYFWIKKRAAVDKTF